MGQRGVKDNSHIQRQRKQLPKSPVIVLGYGHVSEVNPAIEWL